MTVCEETRVERRESHFVATRSSRCDVSITKVVVDDQGTPNATKQSYSVLRVREDAEKRLDDNEAVKEEVCQDRVDGGTEQGGSGVLFDTAEAVAAPVSLFAGHRIGRAHV